MLLRWIWISKQLEQSKCKIEHDLAEVNGQLSSMKKCYADMEKRNTHLRNAFVQKLKFCVLFTMLLSKLILPPDQWRLVSGNVSSAELYWHSANGKLLFGTKLPFILKYFFRNVIKSYKISHLRVFWVLDKLFTFQEIKSL